MDLGLFVRLVNIVKLNKNNHPENPENATFSVSENATTMSTISGMNMDCSRLLHFILSIVRCFYDY